MLAVVGMVGYDAVGGLDHDLASFLLKTRDRHCCVTESLALGCVLEYSRRQQSGYVLKISKDGCWS